MTADTAADPVAPPSASRRWARRLLLLAAVLTLLAAAAWWGVPALLKSQLPPRLEALLGRPVSLAGARFDPLRMALDLQGLRIGAAATASADAPPLLLIDRLQVDLNLPMALRHRAPVVDALAIDGLQLRLARTGAGRLDIDDVITRLAGPGTPAEPSEPARFALYNLTLRNGQILFDDQPVARKHQVQAITLDLPFLSNLPGDTTVHTKPRLAFNLDGTVFDSGSQALPFAETRSGDLNLAFQDFDLVPWMAYLPADLPVRLQRGRLDSTLQVRFAMPPQGAPTVAVQGRIGLRDMALADAAGAPLAAWQSLALDLQDVQPLARRVGLGPLVVDGLVVHLSRDAQGRLNLQRLQAPRGAAAPAAPAAPPAASGPAPAGPGQPWQLAMAGLQLRGAQVHWRDDGLRPAATYTLADLSLQLSDLRWPAPPPVPVQLQARLHRGGADGPITARLSAEGTAHDRAALLALSLEAPDLATLAPYTATVLKPQLRGALAARAQLRWTAEPAALAVQLDDASLRNLQLLDGAGRRASVLAGVKQLQLTDTTLDLQARQVALGSLRIDQPSASVHRQADGQIDLSAWLPASAGATPATAQPAEAMAGTAPPWRISLKNLALQGGRLAWSDAAAGTPDTPLRAELAGLRVQLQGLAWPATARTAPARLQVAASVGAPARPGDAAPQRGKIDWNGRIGLAPLLADGRLQLDRLPIHLFMPYAGDALPADLQHADASLSVQLQAASTPAGWQISTRGDLQITEVMLHTRAAAGEPAGSELLSWESLALQGLTVTLQPAARPRVEVGAIALNDFYSRLVITEQGRFNLQDVAAPAAPAASAPVAAAVPSAAPAASPASAAAAVAGTVAADSGFPIDLVLGRTDLRNGRIDFSDRFVRPNYSARLTELNGSIGPLRSGTRDMATIAIRGRAADTALLDISGQFNPTVQPPALDIRAKATDLELAPLSPYAGKYAGYAIERGKLSMDVAYHIDAAGKLDAKNQVVLNQLTFGERVESPSATQLPVLLAVALLKDRNGVIDINLPVSGTLDDPQFSVGGIIVKVIVNLLTKALTAPFALLAGGGADDVSQVKFVPGTARIADGGQQVLAKVASALLDRPSLTMTVTGAADTVSERDDAKRLLLDERLAAEARRDRLRAAPAAQPATPAVPASGIRPADPPPAPLSAAERAAALKRLYQQTPLPDRPRNLINQLKDVSPAEMETRLLAGIRITDDTMRELALQRGLAVRDALIAKGLPSERLFLAAPRLRLSGEGDAAWVPSVNLTLSANR